MGFQQDGLTFTNTFAMTRDLRQQAVRDFPVLRAVGHLLRTSSGCRMERWDALALPIELKLLGHTSSQVARVSGKCRKTIRRLRDRLIAGGVLKATCECGKPLNHLGMFCSFRRELL